MPYGPLFSQATGQGTLEDLRLEVCAFLCAFVICSVVCVAGGQCRDLQAREAFLLAAQDGSLEKALNEGRGKKRFEGKL